MSNSIRVNAGELKTVLKVLAKNLPTRLADAWDSVRINVIKNTMDENRPHLYLMSAVSENEPAFMEVNIPCEERNVDVSESFRIVVCISALKSAMATIPNKETVILTFRRDAGKNVESLELTDESGSNFQFDKQDVSYYGEYTGEFNEFQLRERERPLAGWMRLPYDDFFNAIEKTHRFISKEETRHYLNGLYVHNGEQIHFCATNAHRLSHAAIFSDQDREARSKVIGSDHEDGVIIPRLIVDKIYAAMKNHSFRKDKSKPSAFVFERYCAEKDENEEDYRKASEGYRTRYQIRCDNWRILFHAIPQKFPDYGRIIRECVNGEKDSVQFNKKQLRDAVQRLAKADKETNMVLMSNSKKHEGRALLESLSLERFGGYSAKSSNGGAHLSVPIKGALPRPVRLNKKYLVDLMDSMDADEVAMNLSKETPENPSHWNAVSNEGSNDDFLLMTVRVSEDEIKERS